QNWGKFKAHKWGGFTSRLEAAEARVPPRDSQSFQIWPSHQRCDRAVSGPTAKMSMRLAPQLTTAGGVARAPPRFCQSFTGPAGVKARWRKVLSAPRAKTSIWPACIRTMLHALLKAAPGRSQSLVQVEPFHTLRYMA